MKPFAKRARTSEVSAIKTIAAEAAKDPDIISICQGVPAFSTPKHIREGVAQALLEDEPGIGKYSVYMGNLKIRQAIADRLTREFSKRVDPVKNIFVSSGGMEGLAAVILALVDPGDEVITPSPDYGPHFQHIDLAEGKLVLAPLDEEKNWSWDPAKVEKAITKKTKLLLLTNPGNPAGNVFSKHTLEQLADLSKKHDLWVLVDETYGFLTFDGIPFVAAATIPVWEDRLIVIRSFSKEYAMTGWRLGYVYGPENLITQALKMHDPLVIAASTVSQKAGYLALTGDQGDVVKMAKELVHRREIACDALDQLAPHFTYVKPQGAYYIFVRVAPKILKKFGPSSEEFAWRMLREAKVAVVPGSTFLPPEDTFIRLTFGGESEKFIEGMERIGRWITG